MYSSGKRCSDVALSKIQTAMSSTTAWTLVVFPGYVLLTPVVIKVHAIAGCWRN